MPVEAQAILPEGLPEADAAMRTYTVVSLTVPPVGTSGVMDDAKPLPDVSDTSKPEGAVTVKLSDKSVPPTVNVCSFDAVPEQAVNGVKVPVVVTVGTAGQGAGAVIIRENLRKVPTSPSATSLTFNVHVPFGSSPLKADNGLEGEKFPCTGAPVKFCIEGNPPSSSSVTVQKLFPLF